ncbi:TraB/GumN family protein [Paraherbaspirillum soli]|uniref:TraB/GumN family protein n=1 Tax=Paraherbaspirillum soli TaxID=631222 RepID=A0ABW0M2I0_9BURK
MFSQIIVTLSALLNRLSPSRVAHLRPHHLLLPLTLGALLLLPTAVPAKDVATDVEAQTQVSRQGGALFKIQRAGHTVYLFGTIHIGRADFYPLDPKVRQALKQSSRIALELDPGNAQAMMPSLQKYGMYADGNTNTQDLPPALQQSVSALLEKNGMPTANLAVMKPWLLATMLALSEYTGSGYQPQYGVDTVLADFAHSQHKPLVELESAEQQLSLMGNLSISDQVLFLQDTVTGMSDPANAKKALQLVALWRGGDLDGLAAMLQELTNDATFSSKFVQRALLDGRNPGLADGIGKLLKSTPTAFAGIGILHLVGSNSVPALLRQRGYSVERIY